MRRFLLLLLPALVVVLAILAAVAYYLLHDETFVKHRLEAYSTRLTGRPLLIDGPLELELGRITTIDAQGVHYPNAPWAKGKDMIRVGHLRVAIDIPSLFDDVPLLPSALLEDCAVSLESNAKGEANWRVFPPRTRDKPKREGPLVVLLDGQVNNCSYTQDSPSRKAPLQVTVQEFALKLQEQQRWQGSGSGKLNGEPLTLTGQLSPPGALIAGKPLNYEVEVDAGKITLHSKGSIQDPHSGAGSDLSVRFTGPEITQVIDYLRLPPFSSGPFDFRLDLDNQGPMSKLKIDGDLGTLKLEAQGEVDRLRRPTRGQVSFDAKGPNLQAFGATLGVDHLVDEAFEAKGAASFKPGAVQFDNLKLDTTSDHATLSGTLGTAAGLAGSDLDLAIDSDEIGRWAPLIGRPSRSFGKVDAKGRLQTNASGAATLKAQINHLGNTLSVDGQLGTLNQGFHPDLQIDFHSANASPLVELLSEYQMPSAPAAVRGHVEWLDKKLTLDQVAVDVDGHKSDVTGVIDLAEGWVGSDLRFDLNSPDLARLGKLLGQDKLPAAPFTARGEVAKPDADYRLKQVQIKLGDHEATFDGRLNPRPGLAGSDLQVSLKSPDITALGRLFGGSGKLVQPLELTGNVKPDGKGLQFRVDDGKIGGSGHIKAHGSIPDLQHPAVLDADFDVEVPSLAPFSVFANFLTWPDAPGSARGHIRNEGDHSTLQDVHAAAGTLQVDLSGEVHTGGRYDLDVQLQGTDASELGSWVHQTLPAQPFALKGQVAGDVTALKLSQLDARLGPSHGGGDLEITLGERAHVEGNLNLPLLDLSWLESKKAEERKDEKAKRKYVFDDTQVARVADIGFDVKLRVAVADLKLVNTRLREVDIGALLTGPRVEVNPFSLKGPSGGLLSGHLSLDNQQTKSDFKLHLSGQDVALGLAVAQGQDMATYPHADLQIDLDATGATRREMASVLNGKVRMELGAGQIARSGAEFLLSDFGTQLLGQLNPFSAKDDYTQVDCAVAGAVITDGQMKVLPLVFQTKQITIFSQGDIDLRTERIDLSFNSKPRQGLGISASALINPFIKVGGTLAEPAVELDPAGAVVGGGTAVATMGLSVIAKGFTDRFLASRDPCGDARKEIAKQDQASQ